MWLVQLNGSDFDIGNIGRQMPNGLPYKIIEVDGYFYLTGEVLDKEESSLDVFRHAQRVIDRLNLASKLLDISHQTVSVEAVRDGEGIRHFHREGHGDSRTSGIAVGQVYTSDGAPLPQERTWFELISDLEQIEELKPVIDEVRALLD